MSEPTNTSGNPEEILVDKLDEFYKDLASKQKPMPPEFAEVLNENIWDLISDDKSPSSNG